MKLDASSLVPRDLHSNLIWLGNCRQAYKFCRGVHDNDPLPLTRIGIDWDTLIDLAKNDDQRRFAELLITMHHKTLITEIVHMIALARLLADGPKIYAPTEEQFESMCHVDIKLAPKEIRLPYEAMVIQVPNQCRSILASRYHQQLNDVTKQVLLYIDNSGDFSTVFIAVRLNAVDAEEVFVFSDQPGNTTVEQVLARRIIDNKIITESQVPPVEWHAKEMAAEIARSCLNLGIMLAHYGYRTGPPLDPEAYAKHRKRKELHHLKHGDYLTIEMIQEVVIRKPSLNTLNPEGPGTGIEVRPHWRRGHWRAYPGQGALRASGQTVPLLFVRPCLIRKDRVSGDISESQATYHT